MNPIIISYYQETGFIPVIDPARGLVGWDKPTFGATHRAFIAEARENIFIWAQTSLIYPSKIDNYFCLLADFHSDQKLVGELSNPNVKNGGNPLHIVIYMITPSYKGDVHQYRDSNRR